MAYLRKYSQGMEIPGYNTGSALLGTGQQTGIAQPTDAGKPGGWTNIQDYLNANQGDNTNINTAKQQTQEKMQTGAGEVSKQQQNLSELPSAVPYSEDSLSKSLASDDYGSLSQNLSQSNAMNQYQMLPDVSQEISGYAPLEQQYNTVANLEPNNFYKTMEFTGSLAPNQPNYSTGMKAFDTMLLQGSPEFRNEFIPQVKEQYQNQYLQPLEQARQDRTAQREAVLPQIEQAKQAWQQGLGDYITGQEGQIKNNLSDQQQHWSNMQNDANMDIEQRKSQYLASTGNSAPPELVNMWTNAKMQAQNFINTQLAPSSATATNQWMQQNQDQTAMQDLMALYGLLGKDATYTMPNPEDVYNYTNFV